MIRIRAFTGGGFAENGYVVACERSGAAVAVDPGAAAGRMVATLRSDGVRLEA
ncbi:MAG: MBL fold metallo-hydrolase, partial [Gemmatimonadetes bacterium]|nr:MBL fold metallo-hydrolase [Gemmatimonadota bacterium]